MSAAFNTPPQIEEAQPVCAYGIIYAHEGETLPSLSGIAQAPLRCVCCDGVAVLISDWPEAAGGELETGIKDSATAQRYVGEYLAALKAVMEHCDVLPLRFGTVLTDEAELPLALGAHRERVAAALTRIAGAREWGVKLYSNGPALQRYVEGASTRLQQWERENAAAKPGHSFFQQRRKAKLSDDEADRVVADLIEASRQALLKAARETADLALQSREAHGGNDEMVWNGTFLVPRCEEARFAAAVAELDRQNAAQGFVFDVTGPWPAFSFADCQLGS